MNNDLSKFYQVKHYILFIQYHSHYCILIDVLSLLSPQHPHNPLQRQTSTIDDMFIPEDTAIYYESPIYSISQRHDPPPGYDHVTKNQTAYPILTTELDIPNTTSSDDLAASAGASTPGNTTSVHSDANTQQYSDRNDRSSSVHLSVDEINDDNDVTSSGGVVENSLPSYSEALEARIIA